MSVGRKQTWKREERGDGRLVERQGLERDERKVKIGQVTRSNGAMRGLISNRAIRAHPRRSEGRRTSLVRLGASNGSFYRSQLHSMFIEELSWNGCGIGGGDISLVCSNRPRVFAGERVSRAILRTPNTILGSLLHYASLYLVKSWAIFSLLRAGGILVFSFKMALVSI